MKASQYVAIYNWLKDNDEDLVNNRTTFTQAATQASKTLGFTVPVSSLTSIAKESDDIAFNGRQDRSSKRPYDQRIAQLEAEVKELRATVSFILQEMTETVAMSADRS